MGGLLVTYVNWHWIFFVNVPIGLVALVFAAGVVPERRAPRAAEGGIDILGILLAAGGLLLLHARRSIQGNDWGWTSPRIVALSSSASRAFPVFFWWETRRQHPMFPLRCCASARSPPPTRRICCIGMAMGGTMLLLVIFMVTVMGYSELRAALVLPSCRRPPCSSRPM